MVLLNLNLKIIPQKDKYKMKKIITTIAITASILLANDLANDYEEGVLDTKVAFEREINNFFNSKKYVKIDNKFVLYQDITNLSDLKINAIISIVNRKNQSQAFLIKDKNNIFGKPNARVIIFEIFDIKANAIDRQKRANSIQKVKNILTNVKRVNVVFERDYFVIREFLSTLNFLKNSKNKEIKLLTDENDKLKSNLNQKIEKRDSYWKEEISKAKDRGVFTIVTIDKSDSKSNINILNRDCEDKTLLTKVVNLNLKDLKPIGRVTTDAYINKHKLNENSLKTKFNDNSKATKDLQFKMVKNSKKPIEDKKKLAKELKDKLLKMDFTTLSALFLSNRAGFEPKSKTLVIDGILAFNDGDIIGSAKNQLRIKETRKKDVYAVILGRKKIKEVR